MFDNLRETLDFNDLLFLNRNRDYGAYQLRKRYNSVVVTGIVVSTLLVSLAVILPYILSPKGDKIITGSIGYVQSDMDNLQPPPDEIYIPPPPPPPGAEKLQEIVKYVPPVVVDSVPPLEKKIASNDEIIAQPTTENFDSGSTGDGNNILSDQDGVATDNAFFIVEVMPTFKGGDINKFREWVMKRTNYPQAAVENKIQGKVYISFVVETDGTVSNVTIVKGVHPLIDAEAIRTIQSSPKWTPGLQRGQAVRVRYIIPLSFSL
jgi:periplasmic protein TonB